MEVMGHFTDFTHEPSRTLQVCQEVSAAAAAAPPQEDDKAEDKDKGKDKSGVEAVNKELM